MATDNTAAQIFQDHDNSHNNNRKYGISRQEIKAAISKAVELRALHTALMHANSPANLRFLSDSPVSHPASHYSAHDYPVFTPSYEEEPLQGYQKIQFQNQTITECWDEYGRGGGEGVGDELVLSGYRNTNESSRKGLPSELASLDSHVCPAEDQISVTASCAATDFYKSSRRNSLGDLRSLSSCNKCKPALLSMDNNGASKNSKNSSITLPLAYSHSSAQQQQKNRGLSLSWLIPRLKRRSKNENSPHRAESEEVSQIFNDLGIMSVETLKKELMEANEGRKAALMEATEMRSSFGELKQKLEYLETYCEELKKALRQAAKTKHSQVHIKLENLPKRGKSIDGNGESLMPVSEEVMVEGFLQIVSEARLSVKQFCRVLVGQIEESDSTLMESLNSLLQPYKLSLNSKYSKAVLYHVESIINQSLYQDFENCVFQKNGSPKLLDPQQYCRAQFSSFVALRNLSWNEVLRKGTKYYSEEFSKFCDQKMSCIVTTLNWTMPWPEQLLHSFFVAAKCLWLLHLLAFSFNPPFGILRVGENRSFDPKYMEDVFMDRQKSNSPGKLKVMVMPGFYMHDRVLRCKVLCRYKSGD